MRPFEAIEAEKGNDPVALMCRQLGVSSSGYYAWKHREPSLRAQRDAVLVDGIRRVHKESHGSYGSPRVARELKEDGIEVGRRRVARLMRGNGITGAPPKRFKVTTDSDHDFGVADNVLEREFAPEAPDMVWATDISYVRTWEGWMYLAVVLDLFSRRVIGWSMATHMRTELVLDALGMALGTPMPRPNMVHHSDRGSQYASRDYRDALRHHRIICSMSRKGDCCDNAVVESFFATLKKELIYRRPWPTVREAREAIAEYVEVFYNTKRMHSTLGYISPAEFERQFEQEAHLAA